MGAADGAYVLHHHVGGADGTASHRGQIFPPSLAQLGRPYCVRFGAHFGADCSFDVCHRLVAVAELGEDDHFIPGLDTAVVDDEIARAIEKFGSEHAWETSKIVGTVVVRIPPQRSCRLDAGAASSYPVDPIAF